MIIRPHMRRKVRNILAVAVETVKRMLNLTEL